MGLGLGLPVSAVRARARWGVGRGAPAAHVARQSVHRRIPSHSAVSCPGCAQKRARAGRVAGGCVVSHGAVGPRPSSPGPNPGGVSTPTLTPWEAGLPSPTHAREPRAMALPLAHPSVARGAPDPAGGTGWGRRRGVRNGSPGSAGSVWHRGLALLSTQGGVRIRAPASRTRSALAGRARIFRARRRGRRPPQHAAALSPSAARSSERPQRAGGLSLARQRPLRRACRVCPTGRWCGRRRWRARQGRSTPPDCPISLARRASPSLCAPSFLSGAVRDRG